MISGEPVFESLPLRRRTLTPIDGNQYNVVANATETKQIKAATAYEAFKLSGFKVAIKIERVSNGDKSLLEQLQFADEYASDAMAKKDSGFLAPARPKSIIVSADELDALMQSMQDKAERHTPVAFANSPLFSASTAALPEPPVTTTNPTGIDVHGEGFDEIIPASPTKPMVTGKLSHIKEMLQPETQGPAEASVSQALPIPDRELSKDEIEKLLEGK